MRTLVHYRGEDADNDDGAASAFGPPPPCRPTQARSIDVHVGQSNQTNGSLATAPLDRSLMFLIEDSTVMSLGHLPGNNCFCPTVPVRAVACASRLHLPDAGTGRRVLFLVAFHAPLPTVPHSCISPSSSTYPSLLSSISKNVVLTQVHNSLVYSMFILSPQPQIAASTHFSPPHHLTPSHCLVPKHSLGTKRRYRFENLPWFILSSPGTSVHNHTPHHITSPAS